MSIDFYVKNKVEWKIVKLIHKWKIINLVFWGMMEISPMFVIGKSVQYVGFYHISSAVSWC